MYEVTYGQVFAGLDYRKRIPLKNMRRPAISHSANDLLLDLLFSDTGTQLSIQT
jgi:hypothetical protein